MKIYVYSSYIGKHVHVAREIFFNSRKGTASLNSKTKNNNHIRDGDLQPPKAKNEVKEREKCKERSNFEEKCESSER